MQVTTRWKDFLIGSSLKPSYSNLRDGYTTFKINVFEPIVLGPGRPSEYVDIGCWSENSTIFPHIERFKLGMEFGDKDLVDLDAYDRNDRTLLSMFNYLADNYVYPRLKILDTSSKLHCSFIANPVRLPLSVPFLDVESFKIAELTLSERSPQTVTFRDILMQRVPKLLMIYAKTMPKPSFEPEFYSDKSASITKLILRTDVVPTVINAVGQHRIDALTTRNFPYYTPPVNKTGNIFCICQNELPEIRTTANNHLFGEVTVEQDWVNYVDVEVYVVMFYRDSYFDVERNYQVKRRIIEPENVFD